MTALSVQQPWAWAIVAGHKTIENRTWGTSFRGLLHIHAGLSKARIGDFGTDYLQECGVVEPAERDLVFGAILGTVNVVECMEYDYLPDAFRVDAFSEGPWCWIFEDAVRFEHPIPCRGMQGLFTPKLGER